jgi:hypothetical protein
LDKLFEKETFDIVFAKYVFHHFIRKSWKSSIEGMKSIIKQINYILKENSYLCIVDSFYNGFLGDTSASKAIYTFTTCKIPILINIFKKLGSHSAGGGGVCFLSKKIWLDIISYGGFLIDELEEPAPTKLKWYMHVGALLKTWNHRCVMVLKK